jgi:TRAP-type C4-dicarboxylate transport system permease small subunit
MALHIIVDVVGRYAFGAPLPGTVEIVARFYMIALVFLPLPFVQKRDEHFVSTVFTDFLPLRARVRLEGVTSICMALVAALLAWAAIASAQHATINHEQVQAAEFVLYTWPTRWLVPIGLCLMSAYAVLNGVRRLVGPASAVAPGRN